MSDTFTLISEEDIKAQIKAQYWAQYGKLRKALNDTMAALRSYGVTEFPDEPFTLTTTPPVKPRETGAFSVKGMILSAGEALGENISKFTVADYLAKTYPERTINANTLGVTFSQVAKEQKWTLTQKGEGGRPAIYSAKPVS
ncbi:MAG: hypothetical protein JWO08_2674 [Verrucomicrobiaceae bacterium]|nr:hypothetical protein [Verrucomicrobiaceae bacterium]